MDEAFCRGFGVDAGPLFPDHLEDFVGEDDLVRVIDAFFECLSRICSGICNARTTAVPTVNTRIAAIDFSYSRTMMCEFAIQLQSRKTRYDAYETVAEYPSVGREQIGAHLPMSGTDQLLQPNQCVLLLIDQQAGLAFGVESLDRQTLLNNTIALLKTAAVFGVPVVVSTSASRVYSGPLMPAVHAALPDVPIIERRSMNVWEDDAARAAVANTGRPRLIMSGLLTEACVTFAALSALADGYEVFVVGDACGGLTGAGHELALQRMAASGVRMTSWIQFLLELQRDWTRHETYDGARAIVEAHGGGYGIGLSYARDMIRPL